MTRSPFHRTFLGALLAGAAAAALAQPTAPKAVTPKPGFEAEIERIARDAERIAEERTSFRWDMFASAGDIDFDFDADHPSFAFIAREFGSTREIVKNAPYQAEVVNEVIQTLSDGNRIVRRTSTSVARDGYGRTRQEKQNGGTVYVFDPIDNKSYALNPERRTAVRIPRTPSLMAPPAPATPAPAAPPAPPVPPAAVAPRAVERVVVRRGGDAKDPKDVEDVRVEVIRVGRDSHATHAITPLPPLALPVLPRGKGEQRSLGTREFEGVKADGTMTSHTIPAGEIGNEKPIVVTSERWFSPELHVVVYAKSSDPRTGDTIYRLANVRRGEPQAELFKLPSDYKVRGR